MDDQVGFDHLFEGCANAATRWVGSSDTKPTVSDSTQSRPLGKLDRAHRRIERGEQQVLGHHVRRPTGD